MLTQMVICIWYEWPKEAIEADSYDRYKNRKDSKYIMCSSVNCFTMLQLETCILLIDLH